VPSRRSRCSRSWPSWPSRSSRSWRARAGRLRLRAPEEHRALVEAYLGDLALTPELHGQVDSVRYALEGGGKRVRPVICLATAEAAGAEPETALPAAAALELVHNFSLVHDDLPALDDDETRRGRPSTWAQYGEAVAVLAGDALLAEAFRLALSYPTPHVARELAQATLGMIGGQYLDITGTAPDEATLHRLKTGCLFAASVGLALWVAEVPDRDQAPWRAFGDELGLLFQIVDDILDGDGYVVTHGGEGARRLADEAAERAQGRLASIDADTSVLGEIVDGLKARTV
jgi:geranylgeranyl diphosphate synthase type II